MTVLSEQALVSSNSEFIRLVQLTDLHLLADPQALLWGNLNTRRSMAAVLAHAGQQCFPVDLMVISGDIAEKAEPEAYQWVLECFQDLEIPVYCLPGNHDDPVSMGKILNHANVSTEPLIRFKAWQIILLNSVAGDKNQGYLAKEQLALLDQSLADRPDLNALIFLHHPPVSIGSDWMDAMGLGNTADFFTVLDQYPNVRGVIWGHIHQEFCAKRHGVWLLGSPSTCVQFAPHSKHFQIDRPGPGYRWLALYPEGQIETQVYYLNDFAGQEAVCKQPQVQ